MKLIPKYILSNVVEEADMECVVQGIIETQVSVFVSSLKFQFLLVYVRHPINILIEY
jgi:hypothetical protein